MKPNKFEVKIKSAGGDPYVLSIEYDDEGYMTNCNYPIVLNASMDSLKDAVKEMRFNKDDLSLNLEHTPTLLAPQYRPTTTQQPEEDSISEDITTETLENGNRVITGITPTFEKILAFFKPESECFFEGCEELKEKYNKELNKEGGDSFCPACKKGGLVRKYTRIIKTLPEFADEEAAEVG
jgi:hypothetical protein